MLVQVEQYVGDETRTILFRFSRVSVCHEYIQRSLRIKCEIAMEKIDYTELSNKILV